MPPRASRNVAVLLAAAISLPATFSPAAASVTFDTRALSGTIAPGTAPGVNYSSFGTPVLNAAGQTAFLGFLTGPGVNRTNDHAIFSGAVGMSGRPGLVVRQRDAAPGTASGVDFGLLDDPLLNAAGQIAFTANLSGPGVDGTNAQTLWVTDASTGLPVQVARLGDAAPGLDPDPASPIRLTDFRGDPVLNAAGQYAFRSLFRGPGVDTNAIGLWVTDADPGTGETQLLARTGQAATDLIPGLSSDTELRGGGQPALNAAGQVAFNFGLTGPGVNSTNNSGLGITDPTTRTFRLIARAGETAPGTHAGGSTDAFYKRFFDDPVLNDAGQVAFQASLTGPGVNASNDTGIWATDAVSGQPRLVVRAGDPAPGVHPGTTSPSPTDIRFRTVRDDIILNAAGQIAFFATLDGPGVERNDVGIWIADANTDPEPDAPRLVAQTGHAAPGTGPDVNFRSFSGRMLNAAGQIAFKGFLTGAGVDGTNDDGLWVTDPSGLLTLILRKGDLFDVSDDPMTPDLRTIASIDVWTNTGIQDGRRSSFNDAGELVFQAWFTDGSSGVFVATIPEPAAGLALGVGVGITLTRRRQTHK